MYNLIHNSEIILKEKKICKIIIVIIRERNFKVQVIQV